jgi:hypothetical protein
LTKKNERAKWAKNRENLMKFSIGVKKSGNWAKVEAMEISENGSQNCKF